LNDYADWVKNQPKLIEESATTTDSTLSNKERKQQEAKKRQQQKPLRDALKKAEKQIDKLSAEQQQLEEKLADNELYAADKKAELNILLEKKGLVDKALEAAEETWLEAQDALDG